MKLENLRRHLILAARAMPVSDHSPVGFGARVQHRISHCLPHASPAEVARAWVDGLGRAAYLAGAIAAAVVVLHAVVPGAHHVPPDSAHEPDLLGHALLADVPGLLDDALPEETIP